MSTREKLSKARLGMLALAEELQNISWACRRAGISEISLSKKNGRFVSDAASPTRIDLRNDEKREIALEHRVADLIHDLGVLGCFKGRGFVAGVSRKANLGMRAHQLCGFRFSAHMYPVNRPVFAFSGGLGNSEVGRISASSAGVGRARGRIE